jgi:hypothetical protein
MAEDDGIIGRDNRLGTGVVDFTGPRMERTSPLLEETWRYWSSLRQGIALPRRDALHPRAMSLILGHSMILDHVREGTIRVRLGGRVLNALMGMEVRGLPFRAFFDLDSRARATALVDQVFQIPAALEMALHAPAQGDLPALSAKLLVLPLVDQAGRPTKALACIALEGAACGAPRRFALERHMTTPIQSSGMPHRRRRDDLPLPGRPRHPSVEPARAAGMAEEPAEFQGRPSGVPWLRVVK